MTRIAFKIAASTMIVSLTMTGFSTQSGAMRRLESSASASREDRQASRLHDDAARALQRGELASALDSMEQAVALAPRDAGYRLLLADVYLKSGRFEAARATYADVLELDSSNVRAGLTYSLMQIALGRPQAAVAQLDSLAGRAPAADVGLAFALAGMPERAIELLEPAARSHDATPRIRQNLALSYALAGDWQRARAVAAQDLSPAEVGPRLEQWANLARPGADATQVASLLGVSPVSDPGQPVRLALAPPAAAPAQAYAEAAPVAEPYAEPDPVAEAYAAADPVMVAYSEAPPMPAYDEPVAYAAAEAPPAEAPAFWVPHIAESEADDQAAPEEQTPAQVQYTAAAQSLIRPQPAIIRASAAARAPTPVLRRETPRAARAGSMRIVVQIGAFSNEANAERAWQEAERSFGLAGRLPLTTTIDINGRTLHRVSVAGFDSSGEAHRLCGSIRAQGGACFVRGAAGDASIRWAARYARERDA